MQHTIWYLQKIVNFLILLQSFYFTLVLSTSKSTRKHFSLEETGTSQGQKLISSDNLLQSKFGKENKVKEFKKTRKL